jgi:acyl carrier protein
MVDDEEDLIRSVIKIIKSVTHSDEVDAASSTENLQKWDSLAYMEIISEIEVTFDVEITEKNIDEFGSVMSIVTVILNKD